MADTKKRHLYYDQQRPSEEPKDAEHTPITPAMFARREPTAEDDYFQEQDRHHALEVKISQKEASNKAQPPSPPTSPEPNTIWERLVRALTRQSKTDWRP